MSDEKPAKAMVQMGERGVKLQTLEDGYRFAQAVVRSGVAPRGDTPETVLVKLQAGAELGMPPMRALSSLVVVHGRLSMMGEAALAKIRASGVCEALDVAAEGEGEDRAGVVRFKRRGEKGPAKEVRFTLSEARKAGLSGDNWKKYTDDMLIWRAVSRASKRYFSDVLMGFDVAEVVREYATPESPQELPPPPTEPDPLLAVAEPVEPAEEANEPIPEAEVVEEPEVLPEPEDEAVQVEIGDFSGLDIPPADDDTQSAIDAVAGVLEKLPQKKREYVVQRFVDWQELGSWDDCRDIEALNELYTDATKTLEAQARRGRKK